MRIIFMGTPASAVPSLRRCVEDGHEVVAVWTQPDRPAGRGNRLHIPPSKRLPLRGCVNVHFSLLPKYRGAAPVNWAVVRGEQETGVTTMLMEEGLDTGPILLQRATPIGAGETAPELL